MSSEINIHDIAEYVVERGLKLGADEVEVYIIFGSIKSVQLERGAIHNFMDTSRSGIGIRVIKNKTIGMSSTTIFEKEHLDKVMKDAISLASVTPPDPNFKSLPSDPRSPPKVEGIFDPNIVELPIEEFVKMINDTVNAAKIREDAIISGRFTMANGESCIVNSQGIDRSQKNTVVGGYLGVKVQEGDDIGNSYYGDSSPLLKEFDNMEIAQKTSERAIKMLGAKKIETKSLPILLDPESTHSTIGTIISSGISAFNVFNRTAFFIDKIGDKIASEKLTIIDDPFYPGGNNTSAFDDEGVVPSKLTLVEDGVLRTYITDSYTAPLVGLENTGHAHRNSFSSRPTPAPYTIQIKNGDAPQEEMLADMKEGIFLLGSPIIGMGNNPQISAQINQGFYVKNGEILHPVKNAVIGTTVFEIFEKIELLSKETENRHGEIAPWMLLAPLRVSGGQ